MARPETRSAIPSRVIVPSELVSLALNWTLGEAEVISDTDIHLHINWSR